MTEPAAMTAPFAHLPVMVDEVVSLLVPSPPGVLLDATLGGAGHARALLDAAPQLTLVGPGPGPGALAAARAVLASYGSRAGSNAPGSTGSPRCCRLGIATLSAALFDLGVSSPQLDRPDRGFSYRLDGPLDMRMDPAETHGR